MYTGTLIDDLMAVVDRAEENTRPATQEKFDNLLVAAICEMVNSDQDMRGAA